MCYKKIKDSPQWNFCPLKCTIDPIVTISLVAIYLLLQCSGHYLNFIL